MLITSVRRFVDDKQVNELPAVKRSCRAHGRRTCRF